MAIMASWGSVTGSGAEPAPAISSAKEFALVPTVQPSSKRVRRMERHPMPPGMLPLPYKAPPETFGPAGTSCFRASGGEVDPERRRCDPAHSPWGASTNGRRGRNARTQWRRRPASANDRINRSPYCSLAMPVLPGREAFHAVCAAAALPLREKPATLSIAARTTRDRSVTAGRFSKGPPIRMELHRP